MDGLREGVSNLLAALLASGRPSAVAADAAPLLHEAPLPPVPRGVRSAVEEALLRNTAYVDPSVRLVRDDAASVVTKLRVTGRAGRARRVARVAARVLAASGGGGGGGGGHRYLALLLALEQLHDVEAAGALEDADSGSSDVESEGDTAGVGAAEAEEVAAGVEASAAADADVTRWRADWVADFSASDEDGDDDAASGVRHAESPLSGGLASSISVEGDEADDASRSAAAAGACQWRDLPPLLPCGTPAAAASSASAPVPPTLPASAPLLTTSAAAALLGTLFLSTAVTSTNNTDDPAAPCIATDPLHAAVAAALVVDVAARGPVSAVVGARAAPPPPASVHGVLQGAGRWVAAASPRCADPAAGVVAQAATRGGIARLLSAGAATVARLHGVEWVCRRVTADVAREGAAAGTWPAVLLAALHLDAAVPVPPAPLWSPTAAALARALLASIARLRHHVTAAIGAAPSLLALRVVLQDAGAAVAAFGELCDAVFTAPLPRLAAAGDAALVSAVDAAVGAVLASGGGDDGAEGVRSIAHAAAVLALAPQVYSCRACDATLRALDAAAALGGRRAASPSGFSLASELAGIAGEVWVVQLAGLDAAMDPLWQYAHPAAAPFISPAAVAGWAGVAAAAGAAAAATAAAGDAAARHAASATPADALAALLHGGDDGDSEGGDDDDASDAPWRLAQDLVASAVAASQRQRATLALPPEVPTLLPALVPTALRCDTAATGGGAAGYGEPDDAEDDDDGGGGGGSEAAAASMAVRAPRTALHAVLDIRRMRLLSADGDGSRLPFARLLLPALPAAALLARATGVAYEPAVVPHPPLHVNADTVLSSREPPPLGGGDSAFADVASPEPPASTPAGATAAVTPTTVAAPAVTTTPTHIATAPHRVGAATISVTAAAASTDPAARPTATKPVLGRGFLPLEGGRRSAWWDIDAQVDVKKKPKEAAATEAETEAPPPVPAPAAAAVVDVDSLPVPVATTRELRRRHRRLRQDAGGGGGAGRLAHMAPIAEEGGRGDDDGGDDGGSEGSRGRSDSSGSSDSSDSEAGSESGRSKVSGGGEAADPRRQLVLDDGELPPPPPPPAAPAGNVVVPAPPARGGAEVPPATATAAAALPVAVRQPAALPPPRAFGGGDTNLLEDLLARAAAAALPRVVASDGEDGRHDTYATLGRSPTSALTEGLAGTLRHMHRAAAADATAVCIHEAGFVRHLWALRAVVLMERADALLPFFDALFTPLRGGGGGGGGSSGGGGGGGRAALRASAALTRRLRTALGSAAGATVSSHPDATPPLLQPARFSVEFVGYDATDAGSLLQRGVAVHYTLPAVLQPLVGPSASGVYNRVFGMLLRLRRSLWELQHGMTEARRASEVLATARRPLPASATLAAAAGHLHRLHCAHACMLQFAVAVHSHVARAVVAEEWVPLLQACAAARHPDDLAAAHARYLAAIERRCLLAPDQRPAAAALTTLATRMDTFASEYAAYYSGMRTACVAVTAAADAARAADAYLAPSGGGGGGSRRGSRDSAAPPPPADAAGTASVQRVADAAFAGPTRIASAAHAAARAFFTQLGLLLRATAATPAASRRPGAATLADVAALLDFNGYYSRMTATGSSSSGGGGP